MKKSKILFFNHSLGSGGSERVISRISNYFIKKDFYVSLVTLSGSNIDDFYDLDPKIKRFKLNLAEKQSNLISKIIYNIKRIYLIRKHIKKYNPNIIISFIETNNIIMILSCLGLKKKIIISERSYPGKHKLPLFWDVLRKILYRYASYLVVQTEKTKEWCINNIANINVVTIPNSVKTFKSSKIKQKIIIGVGRLETQKGYDLLINAFAKIHREFEDWNIQLYGSGSALNELNKLVNDLNLNSKVKINPPIKNIIEEIAKSSIMVHPARYEGFPNVILESMSAGTVVAAADCYTGPSEIIKNKINGILFPVDNVDLLADSLRILISDQSIRKKYESNAGLTVRSFSEQHIMQKWEKLINQL